MHHSDKSKFNISGTPDTFSYGRRMVDRFKQHYDSSYGENHQSGVIPGVLDEQKKVTQRLVLVVVWAEHFTTTLNVISVIGDTCKKVNNKSNQWKGKLLFHQTNCSLQFFLNLFLACDLTKRNHLTVATFNYHTTDSKHCSVWRSSNHPYSFQLA